MVKPESGAQTPTLNLQIWSYPREVNRCQRQRWGKPMDFRRAVIALVSLPLDPDADPRIVNAIMAWALGEGQHIDAEATNGGSPDFSGLVERLTQAINSARKTTQGQNGRD